MFSSVFGLVSSKALLVVFVCVCLGWPDVLCAFVSLVFSFWKNKRIVVFLLCVLLCFPVLLGNTWTGWTFFKRCEHNEEHHALVLATGRDVAKGWLGILEGPAHVRSGRFAWRHDSRMGAAWCTALRLTKELEWVLLDLGLMKLLWSRGLL